LAETTLYLAIRVKLMLDTTQRGRFVTSIALWNTQIRTARTIGALTMRTLLGGGHGSNDGNSGDRSDWSFEQERAKYLSLFRDGHLEDVSIRRCPREVVPRTYTVLDTVDYSTIERDV